jgi:S-DNA-T family DNA segregation ATPase FtsK/SpoIIIE
MSNMILSFASKYSPSELKFMLIDPRNYNLKKLDAFENLPHLLGSTVFKEDNEILDAFSDVIAEINRRADYLSEMGAPTIESYNNCEAVLKGKLSKMPYVVIIVNKFENVISINKQKIERFVQILTSKAKSCGFNLVIGTEKATEDVLTNIIVKHIHSKLFFKTKQVSSKYVSILPEADLLFSQGDMYLLPFGEKTPQRIQCTHINYSNCQNYVDDIISKYKRKK